MDIVDIKTVEYFLKQWKNELTKRDYTNKCSEYMEETLRIFYTVSYLEHYIELLKETGREGDRMDNCKDCIHYDNSNTYEGSGYCHLWDDYMKDNYDCEFWEGD